MATKDKISLTTKVGHYLREVQEKKKEARKLPGGDIVDCLTELNAKARIFVLTLLEQTLLDNQSEILQEASNLSNSPLSESDVESIVKRLALVRKKRWRTEERNISTRDLARILDEERAKIRLAPPERDLLTESFNG